RGDPGARRHGLHQRNADRAAVARREALRDRRRHFRDPPLADWERTVFGDELMARLSTPLCERLGMRLPIIQAPMAGGPWSKELVAACAAAGALGSCGHAYTQPDEMKRQSEWVRANTDRPFGINLFVSPQPAPVDLVHQQAALAALGPWYAEMGLPLP